MARIRSLALALTLVSAVACSDAAEDPARGGGGTGGSGTGGSGTGGTGAVGPTAGGTGAVGPGAGGTGADAYGGTSGSGTGGSSFYGDTFYECPDKPYAAPSAMVLTGDPPAIVARAALGDEATELLLSAVALPDGGAAAIAARGTQEESEFVLLGVGGDGSATELLSWTRVADQRAFVAADSDGNVTVAGVAIEPLEFDGEMLGTELGSEADGFVYVVDIDASGAVTERHAFPFEGGVALQAIRANADGELALAGSLTTRLEIGDAVVETPEFEVEPLNSSFVLRLDAERELVWQRVFHATGKHNDPPSLDGTGGTDGFGQSGAVDVAWGSDGSVVASAMFMGGIDLDDVRYPNDGSQDVLVVKLDADGETAWSKHVYGVLATHLPNPDGAGGIGGTIPESRLGVFHVAVAPNGRVALTGSLSSRAVIDGTVVDAGQGGALTVVLTGDGEIESAVPDGGNDLVFGPDGKLTVWDGNSIFGLEADGSSAWARSFAPASLTGPESRLLPGPEGPLVVGSFVGKLDLGGETLESSGCADVFVTRFAP